MGRRTKSGCLIQLQDTFRSILYIEWFETKGDLNELWTLTSNPRKIRSNKWRETQTTHWVEWVRGREKGWGQVWRGIASDSLECWKECR